MNKSQIRKVISLARKYSKEFETRKRDDGSEFVCRKGDKIKEDDLQILIREAHDGMLPDDYKYQFIEDALLTIADSGEIKDEDQLMERTEGLDTEYYNANYCKWLASNLHRGYYAEEAMANGFNTDFWQMMAYSYRSEQEEVFYEVLQQLKSIVSKTQREAA